MPAQGALKTNEIATFNTCPQKLLQEATEEADHKRSCVAAPVGKLARGEGKSFLRVFLELLDNFVGQYEMSNFGSIDDALNARRIEDLVG